MPSLRHPIPVAATGFALLTAVSAVPAGAAAAPRPHCVIHVTGQNADGRFITTEPVCYPTLAEALADAGLDVDPRSNVSIDAVARSGVVTTASSSIGIHYDGSNRSGASITVTGADCNGGYVNLSSDWIDRISSTLNNCPAVRFFDGYNKSGTFEQTTPSSWNLGALNNAANSISYGS